MMIRKAWAPILLALICACASKEFNEPGQLPPSDRETSTSFNGSYGDVWKATLAAMTEKKYPVASSNKETGSIVSDWVLGKSDRLFSGYGETRIPYNIRSKFTLTLKPQRSGVHVSISNMEQYYSDSVTAGIDFSGSVYQWIPTQSSSAKEGALLDEIRTQLKTAASPK